MSGARERRLRDHRAAEEADAPGRKCCVLRRKRLQVRDERREIRVAEYAYASDGMMARRGRLADAMPQSAMPVRGRVARADPALSAREIRAAMLTSIAGVGNCCRRGQTAVTHLDPVIAEAM